MRRICFAIALGTTVVLLSAGVVLLPLTQRVLVAVSPTAIPAPERVAAARQLMRYFATGDRRGLNGYHLAEQAHLREVAAVLRTLTGILGLALTTVGAAGWRVARRDGMTSLRREGQRVLRATAAVCLILSASLPLLFRAAFAGLHPLLFTAPWTFDPLESRLINQFPPEYFRATFLFTLLTAAVISLALSVNWNGQRLRDRD